MYWILLDLDFLIFLNKANISTKTLSDLCDAKLQYRLKEITLVHVLYLFTIRLKVRFFDISLLVSLLQNKMSYLV